MSFFTSLLGGISTALGVIPGLQPVASGLSSIFGNMTASDQLADERNWAANQAQINRDFQKSERLETQAFNLDMWNRNNQYNSPAAQLQRMEAAGINPNAAVAGVSNPANSTPVTSTPMSGAMASTPASIAGQMLMQDAQVNNLMANTRKQNADADAVEYGTSWNKMTEGQRYDSLVNMNGKTKQDIAESVARVGNIKFDQDMQEKTFRWFAAKTKEEINQIKEQTTLLYNQSQDILKGIKLKDKQMEHIDAQIENLEYQNDKLDAETAGHILKNEGTDIENQLKELEKNFCNITGVPMGAPEAIVQWSLFKDGRFMDFMDYLSIGAYNNSVTGEVQRSINAKRFTNMIDDASKAYGKNGRKFDKSYSGSWYVAPLDFRRSYLYRSPRLGTTWNRTFRQYNQR